MTNYNRKTELNALVQKYSPDKQYKVAERGNGCFAEESITLNELKSKFGEVAPAIWLNPQLLDLALFSNTTNVFTEYVVRELSSVIASQFGYLKISELMLFFHNYKSGKYGRIYSAMDVTTALRQFCKERENVLYDLRRNKENDMREAQFENSITYSEYLKIKNKNQH